MKMDYNALQPKPIPLHEAIAAAHDLGVVFGDEERGDEEYSRGVVELVAMLYFPGMQDLGRYMVEAALHGKVAP